jgi:hypothetical protein
VPSWVKSGSVFLEKSFKYPTPFSHLCDYLPFEKNLTLYLNRLEFSLSKDNLYQLSLIEFGLLVLEEKIFKIFSVFLLFCYYLPLEKGVPLHLNKLDSPPPKDDFCQIWLKLAQWFWRRSQKCRSLQTDGQRDNRRSEYSSSFELSAQVS